MMDFVKLGDYLSLPYCMTHNPGTMAASPISIASLSPMGSIILCVVPMPSGFA